MRLSYNGANAHYNSLQTTLTGTVTHDLHLQVSYTLAKAVDATTASGSGGDLNNATNPYQGPTTIPAPLYSIARTYSSPTSSMICRCSGMPATYSSSEDLVDGRSPESSPRNRERRSTWELTARRRRVSSPTPAPVPTSQGHLVSEEAWGVVLGQLQCAHLCT